MFHSLKSSRLSIEWLVLLALPEAALLYALPVLAPVLSWVNIALLNVVLLLLVAGPAMFWRYLYLRQRAAQAQGKPRDSDVRKAIAMAATAQLIGMALTAAAVVWVHQAIEANSRTKFDRLVERLELEIDRRFDQPAHGLNGLAGLYAGSKSVERGEFRAYVAARDLLDEFPGIRGFGFIQRVMREDVARFIAAEQVDEAPDFAVRSSGEASDMYVIKYIEPLSNNRAAWGYDVGSESVRRQAVELAVNTGLPTLTGSVVLVQDGRRSAGFLLLRPVYRNDSAPQTPQARQAALVGVLYSPIVLAELMAGVIDATERLLAFDLLDGTVAASTARFSSEQPLTADTTHLARSRFESSRQIKVGGRVLTLHAGTTSAFEASVDHTTALWLSLGGAMLSALLALAVWLLASGRVRALSLAQRMTADLDRLAKVVERTANAVSITDTQLRITWVNDGFTRISGYSMDEALGRTPGELLGSGKSDPAALETLRTAALAGEGCRVQLINRAKDGREYWTDTEVQPTRNAAGALIGFMEIGTDITESKLAKEKLEVMANRLTLATEGSNDGLWHVIDVNTGEEWWSPKFYALLGYGPGELKPGLATFRSLLHPDHLEMMLKATRDALSAIKPFDIEYLVRTKSGEYRWFRGRAKVYFDASGKAKQMAGSMQDIHEHKLAQQKLIDSERFLRTITDGVPARVAYWTKEQRCAFANQASIEWFGGQRKNVVGLSMRELLGAEVYSDAEPFVLGALRGERQEFERTDSCADGSVRHDLVQYVPDVTDGVLGGFFVLVSDITERKKSEDLLKDAMQHAEQASLAKGQFVANMSHEIRTPMNAVLGMLKVLQQTALTQQQLDYVAETEGAARLLMSLLNDILDFSKIEAGKMALDLQPFSTERLLRDLSVILSANVGAKKLDVLFDIDPAVPGSLIGDNVRLLQILINLGVNAIKFTERGETVLRVRVAEQRGNAVLLEFSVRDTGIGIAPEHHERIFTGFSQAEASTTRRFGGTGLGLAICQRLIAMMGGQLMLESALGAGSNFYFRIELAVSDELAVEQVPTPRADTPGLRALIVDDNAKAREVLAGMAQSLGWQVDVAASSAEAIALTQASAGTASPYDAVFVDSGMSEWEICQRVQESSFDAQSPVVISVTTHGLEAKAKRGADRRFLTNGLLVKPATASMLFDAVAFARADQEGQNTLTRGRALAPKQGPLSGMRVLVVDDNRPNQTVAQLLLAGAGAHIELASNGEEAVAAVVAAEPPFDVVLMDIQMPVMDGYAATAEIQRRLSSEAPPIIAMTANATASDREACLAAGMVDHVGKPFDLSRLIATLTQHTGKAASTALPTPTAQLPDEVVAETARQGIDLQNALRRLGGNTGVYVRMAQSFRKDLAAAPKQLVLYLQQGQYLEACRLMHTIKGVAGTLGIKRLAVLAQETELSLRDAAGPELHEQIVADMRNAARDASADIARTVEHLTASAPRMHAFSATSDLSNGAELGPLLDELAGLLRESDMRAVDVYAQLQLTHTALLGESAQPLDESMSMLDFQQALAHCQALQRNFAT